MYSLDKAVGLVLQWTAARQKDRERAVALLGELVHRCEDALKVWQDYTAAPGAPGDKFSIVTWVGAQRANQLLDINLRAKQQLAELTTLAGPAAGRFDGLDEDIIETAYRQLREGETGPDAAAVAVQKLKARIQYLQGLAERIRKTPPAKGGAAATRPAGKKPAARKAPAKKKAAAKKKPAARKRAKKKTRGRK